MEKTEKVSVMDLLLRPELPDVRKALPEKQVEVTRLSELAGEPVVFRLRVLTYPQVRAVQDRPAEDRALHILLDGCVEPDFRDKRLLAPERGIATPLDAIRARLTPGEIDELSCEVQQLSGYLKRTVRDVKNG